MKRSQLYQQVTARIVAELEAGAIPWTRPWTRRHRGSVMPENAATGRAYSGINIPILWGEAIARGYDRHQWLTYRQAQGLGAQVRKGEQGTVVVFTTTIERDDETETPKRISMLRTYSVFNIAQVDGLPEKTEAVEPVPEPERIARADAFIQATEASIRIGGDQAFYAPGADVIVMPAIGQFRDASSYYATLLHECGHWSGARHRLDRDLTGRFGTAAYAGEELVAELTAAFLAAHLGLTGELRHAGYIADWIKLLKADDRAIFTAASKASEAATYLRRFSETEAAGDDSDAKTEATADAVV